MKEDQNIYINKSISTETDNSEESPDEEEKMSDINSDFLDITNINDNISSKGKSLKNIIHEYTDLKGNLNIKNNLFIQASNKFSKNAENKPKQNNVNKYLDETNREKK